MRGLVVVPLFAVACDVPTGPAARDIDVTFESAPAAATNEVVAEFVFSAEGELSFTCQLDGATQMECTSPQSITVVDGEHTFSVRALDVSRAASPPASHTWLVDTEAPLLVVSGPELTSDTTPEFALSSTTVPVALRCRVDGGAFETCASPFTPTLADGPHTLDFEAEDAATNVGTATRTITIDSATPAVTIVAPLIPARVGNTQPAVAFTVSDATSLTIECALDAGAFATCTSPFAAATPLTEGAHVYHLRATDAAGNQGTANASFIVDTTPPDLQITVTPPSPGTDTTPTFEFTVSGQQNVGCVLSTGELISACTSPVTFGPLTPSVRTFSVLATDDATPVNSVTRTFDFEIIP